MVKLTYNCKYQEENAGIMDFDYIYEMMCGTFTEQDLQIKNLFDGECGGDLSDDFRCKMQNISRRREQRSDSDN